MEPSKSANEGVAVVHIGTRRHKCDPRIQVFIQGRRLVNRAQALFAARRHVGHQRARKQQALVEEAYSQQHHAEPDHR